VRDLNRTLNESIVRICGVTEDRVRPESTLDKLGIDSLTAAELITDLEIRLGEELPVDVLRRLNRVGTVGEVAAELSRDGKYVVFDSSASNLVPNDTNKAVDVFRYNTHTGGFRLASVATGRAQADAASIEGWVSGSGATWSSPRKPPIW
jgi:acyl carrier protein